MQPRPPRGKTHILLLAGRKLLRQGQSALLERYGEFRVVGETDDARAAPKLVKALAPDVVIFNVSLSTRDAADAVHHILAARAAARVLVLGLHTEPAFIREVLRAGAAGCLTRECSIEELVQAIHTCAGGQVYLSPAVASTVVNGYVASGGGARIAPPGRAGRGSVATSAAGKSTKALSAREREILQHVAEGQSTKEIARALAVSSKTIETYRRRIMEKLGRHSVAELTKYAVREGLTSLETHGQ